jgi:hypothetical protein
VAVTAPAMAVLVEGNKSSAVLRGTHCHLHVGPVPHVSESSPSAVLQRRLIPGGADSVGG